MHIREGLVACSFAGGRRRYVCLRCQVTFENGGGKARGLTGVGKCNACLA